VHFICALILCYFILFDGLNETVCLFLSNGPVFKYPGFRNADAVCRIVCDQIVLNGILKDHMHKGTQSRQIVLTESIFIYKTGKFCNMVLDHQIFDSSDGHVPELTKMHTNEPFICNIAGN